MKKTKLFLMIIAIGSLTLTTTSCSKEEGCTDSSALNYQSDADEDDGSCNYNGNVAFWQYSGDSYQTTSVSLNNETKSITLDFSISGPDGCSSTGPANFTLAPGNYSYTASENGGGNASWSGNITIESKGCLKFRLKP